MNKWYPCRGVPPVFSTVLCAVLLSSCASFGPEVTPAEPLSAQQLQLAAASQQSLSPAWWQQLHDPTLNRLMDSALQQSPSLKLADARLREARSSLGLSESQLGPKLDANASLDRERYSLYGLFPPPVGGNYYNTYTLSLNASWELDFWGKRQAEVKAALGNQQAVALDAQQARLMLAQSVLMQYTLLQAQLAQSELMQTRIQLAQSRLTLMQARRNAGLVPADVLHTNTIQINQLRQQLQALLAAIEQSRHALSALSGQPPYALNSLKPGTLSATPALLAKQLTTQLLGQRPDIAAQRMRVEAMHQSVSAAKALFYPNISLSAFVGLSSLERGDLFNSQARVLGITPALSLPIFHSGELRANLSGARARYDIAVESYNQTVLDALQEAADKLSDWQKTTAQLSQAQQAASSSTKASRAERARFQAGLSNKLAWLSSQDSELAQQSAQLEALANQRLAWITVNTALGGAMLPSDVK